MESTASLCRQVASSSPPSGPQVARQFPEPMPVVLKVRLGGTPVATLHTNNATLRLQPFVEVLASASNSAFHSLFSLDVVSEVGWVGLAGRALIVSLLICSALSTLVSLLFLQCSRIFLPQDLGTGHTLCRGYSSPGSCSGWLLFFQVSA